MNEKTFKVEIEGLTPLIMNNGAAADPLHPLSRAKKEIQKKRNKTESDQLKLENFDFEMALYFSEELGGLYIPSDCLHKMILEAGRKVDSKKAKSLFPGVQLTRTDGYPLEVKNRGNLKELIQDQNLRYRRMVIVSKARVPKVRCKFPPGWKLQFELTVDESIIDARDVLTWLEYAGKRCGLGDRRPSSPTPNIFGTFYVEKFEEIK